MSQHREVTAFLSHCFDPNDRDTRCILNATSSSDLNTVGNQRRIISDDRKRCNVDHCRGGSRIQSQTQNDAP